MKGATFEISGTGLLRGTLYFLASVLRVLWNPGPILVLKDPTDEIESSGLGMIILAGVCTSIPIFAIRELKSVVVDCAPAGVKFCPGFN